MTAYQGTLKDVGNIWYDQKLKQQKNMNNSSQASINLSLLSFNVLDALTV